MTMNEKLKAANKRYDEALYNYMRVGASKKNEQELKEASADLNKAIDEAEKETTTLLEKMKVDLITAAGRMNSDAERKDINRNHVNYGVLTKCADVLRIMGCEVKTPCYGDGDFLKVEKITIDGKEINYHNG